MPPPEDTMRDRIELIKIMNAMREAEGSNLAASRVVQDLSKQDQARLKTAELYFGAGARIRTMRELKTAGAGIDVDFTPLEEIARSTAIRYRIAERRNVGRRSLTFRDDDD